MNTEALNFTVPYGIILRKDSLKSKSISLPKILSTLESEAPFHETEHLLSVGPIFGPEASNELSNRLENLGLNFFIDYYYFEHDLPEWLHCQVSFRH